MGRSLARGMLAAAAMVIAPAAAPAQTADPARAAIEKQGKVFADAYNRGDIAAVAALYAEDAMAFPPNADIVRGRAAIESLWKGVRDSGVSSVAFDVLDVQSSGSIAVEVGTATLHMQAAGKPAAKETVKYVVAWKRQGDGAWKLFRDIWNSMPPAK